MTSVLIVEDDPKIRANLLFQMREKGLAPTAVENAEAALSELLSGSGPRPDLLLLDVRLPGLSGVELVRRLSQAGRLPPTIIISGEASISETVEALKLGVHDFIEKPFSKERLLRSIDNTLEHTALREEVAVLRSELDGAHEILGHSPAIELVRERIAQAAPTEARVLIRGESGTGKELVADALHRGSERRGRPFIKVNCAAIASHLIEDELFGHVRGAFTDARADKAGLFEMADGGTLFLDEVGDMEYTLQSRLLRVLEDGRVRRLGDSRDREVDVRVFAATHADLETAIGEKRFREDLFFRLAHLPIDLPPLRERREDVPLLVEHFLRRLCRRHKARPLRIEAEALAILEAGSWPGNVRELKSLCERLVVFGSDPITPEQIPAPYRSGAEPDANNRGTGTALDAPTNPDGKTATLREFKERSEREFLDSVLAETRWNVAAAARRLDIRRTHLHQKLARHGLHRPK